MFSQDDIVDLKLLDWVRKSTAALHCSLREWIETLLFYWWLTCFLSFITSLITYGWFKIRHQNNSREWLITEVSKECVHRDATKTIPVFVVGSVRLVRILPKTVRLHINRWLINTQTAYITQTISCYTIFFFLIPILVVIAGDSQ